MLILKGILWMLAALLGIGALCGFCLWMEKRAPSEEYDERQKIEQGKASNISLVTGLLYFIVVMCWMYLDEMHVDTVFLIFTGLLLELMVYHVYCLMTHAALPLSRKPWVSIGNYTILGVAWALRASMYDPSWGMTLEGSGSRFWMHVMTSFCCLSLAAMHLISCLRDKRE